MLLLRPHALLVATLALFLTNASLVHADTRAAASRAPSATRPPLCDDALSSLATIAQKLKGVKKGDPLSNQAMALLQADQRLLYPESRRSSAAPFGSEPVETNTRNFLYIASQAPTDSKFQIPESQKLGISEMNSRRAANLKTLRDANNTLSEPLGTQYRELTISQFLRTVLNIQQGASIISGAEFLDPSLRVIITAQQALLDVKRASVILDSAQTDLYSAISTLAHTKGIEHAITGNPDVMSGWRRVLEAISNHEQVDTISLGAEIPGVKAEADPLQGLRDLANHPENWKMTADQVKDLKCALEYLDASERSLRTARTNFAAAERVGALARNAMNILLQADGRKGLTVGSLARRLQGAQLGTDISDYPELDGIAEVSLQNTDQLTHPTLNRTITVPEGTTTAQVLDLLGNEVKNAAKIRFFEDDREGEIKAAAAEFEILRNQELRLVTQAVKAKNSAQRADSVLSGVTEITGKATGLQVDVLKSAYTGLMNSLSDPSVFSPDKKAVAPLPPLPADLPAHLVMQYDFRKLKDDGAGLAWNSFFQSQLDPNSQVSTQPPVVPVTPAPVTPAVPVAPVAPVVPETANGTTPAPVAPAPTVPATTANVTIDVNTQTPPVAVTPVTPAPDPTQVTPPAAPAAVVYNPLPNMPLYTQPTVGTAADARQKLKSFMNFLGRAADNLASYDEYLENERVLLNGELVEKAGNTTAVTEIKAKLRSVKRRSDWAMEQKRLLQSSLQQLTGSMIDAYRDGTTKDVPLTHTDALRELAHAIINSSGSLGTFIYARENLPLPLAELRGWIVNESVAIALDSMAEQRSYANGWSDDVTLAARMRKFIPNARARTIIAYGAGAGLTVYTVYYVTQWRGDPAKKPTSRLDIIKSNIPLINANFSAAQKKIDDAKAAAQAAAAAAQTNAPAVAPNAAPAVAAPTPVVDPTQVAPAQQAQPPAPAPEPPASAPLPAPPAPLPAPPAPLPAPPAPLPAPVK